LAQPGHLEFDDNLIRAQTIGTVNSIVAKQRRVVLITADCATEDAEGDVHVFFVQTYGYLESASVKRLTEANIFSKVDAFAWEVYPGITIVPDELFDLLSNTQVMLATVIPNIPIHKLEEQIGPALERLTQRYAECRDFTGAENGELKRRLFTPNQMIMKWSELNNRTFVYTFEHEWSHLLIQKYPRLVEILEKGWSIIRSKGGLAFDVAMVFCDSTYGRFPSVGEFWAQWYRPTMGRDSLSDWENFKS